MGRFSQSGNTPSHIAARNAHHAVLQVLMTAGDTLTKPNKVTMKYVSTDCFKNFFIEQFGLTPLDVVTNTPAMEALLEVIFKTEVSF